MNGPAFDLLVPARAAWESPLELLEACHRNIERRLDLLFVIATAVEAGDPARAVPDAVGFVLSYFHDGLQRHTADEDLDLFPLLRRAAPDLESVIVALEADHRALEFVHNDLDAVLAQILHAPEPALAGRLRELADYIVPRYRHHLQTEEAQVFPRARALLVPDQLLALGATFRNRRGL